jgi:hypothetical protein
MRELAEDARLAQKAIASLAAGEFRGEKLYGHRAVNQGVITADHAAGSPCADSFEDLVTSDLQDGGLLSCTRNAGGESSQRRIEGTKCDVQKSRCGDTKVLGSRDTATASLEEFSNSFAAAGLFLSERLGAPDVGVNLKRVETKEGNRDDVKPPGSP